jgi:hypothetical protein
MSNKDRRGLGLAVLFLIAFTCGIAWVVTSHYASAAALTPPIGFIVRADAQRYALGRSLLSVGTGVGTTEITVSGLLATDIVGGIANLSTPTETPLALSAITAAAGKVTASTGITNDNKYIVHYVRPLGAGQQSW